MLFFYLLLSLSPAKNHSLTHKEMSFLSEAVTKSLVSCEKIRGATLQGSFSFENKTNDVYAKDAFLSHLKSELRKNMGTRFDSSKKKSKTSTVAILTSEKFEDGGVTGITYKLKLSFYENKELFCEAENEISKTFKK